MRIPTRKTRTDPEDPYRPAGRPIPTRKTDYRQNNQNVKAVSPRHCVRAQELPV